MQWVVAARAAARRMAIAPTNEKRDALRAAAESIRLHAKSILEANAADVARSRAAGDDEAFIDRLRLTVESLATMADGVAQVATLPDPVGLESPAETRPSGITLSKMRVPLGVIGMIYESRPNVTADAAALCVMSGNACILRGGSEAFDSNRAIHAAFVSGLRSAGLPAEAVQLVSTTDRAAVGAMLTMKGHIDIIIPRGGKSLIARVAEESKIPVLKHLDGICHVYVDEGADLDMALRIADNAKTQRYSTCNTMETLARSHAKRKPMAFLPRIGAIYAARRAWKCVRAPRQRAILDGAGSAQRGGRHRTKTFHTEYLAPIVSIRIVDGIDAAMEHIARYGSQHTESIVTRDAARAERFLREVDSASVMVNASTRFADGFEFGLGAEIGISTDKLHARGPVGLIGLTSEKWIVRGHGEVRG